MPIFGVHVPHRKHTASSHPERMPIPKTVVIPMSMHIGAPAKPVVKVGDTVGVGQLIGEAGGFVSAPIHSSVSGTVKKIDTIPGGNGSPMTAITIESDDEMRPYEDITPPVVTNYDEFVAAVRASGIVGLGGAGFPTSVKLSVKDLSKIDYVILNGAECEPYITADTLTMTDRADDIFEGIQLLEKYLGVKIYLNIVQLSDMTKLNKLAVDYDLLSRLTLIGIDADHYGLITKDDTIIPFYLEKDFSSEEHSEMKKGTFSVPEELDEYGASGLVVKASEADETVIEALDDYGIPFIVTSVNNNRKLSEVLLANAQTVWVNDIEKSEKFLSEWIKEMQIRYENSVASSLKALSTTTENK